MLASMRRRLLAEALRERLLGEVWEEDGARAAYAASASIFRHVPELVVAPRDPADVARVVQFARDEGMAITPRGAGTSRAGQDQGEGILLDMTRHFRARPAIDAGARRARVLPGLTLRELNEAARRHGLHFPPDPSSGAFCTIGGMVANGAGGPSAMRTGITRDWVLGLDVVLASGEGAHARRGEPAARWAAGLARAAEVLAREAELVRLQYPHRVKNSSGYNLKGTVAGAYGWPVPPGPAGPAATGATDARARADAGPADVDPFPLLIGSEGTLAIVTAAHVRLAPLPGGTASLLLLFDDLADAARAVPALTASGAGKIEMMDRVLLERVRDVLGKGRAAADALLADPFRYALLVEHDGTSRDEARDGSAGALAALGSATRGRVLDDPAESARLWQVRSMAAGHLHLLPGRKRPIAIVEDGAVDPAALPAYVEAVRAVHRRAGVESFYFGHAGDGNVHVNSLLDLADPDDARRARDILDGVHAVLRDMGGSLSGEHGDGRLRTPYLRAHYGALFDRVFVPVKRALDPDGLLNPGIVAAPERQGADALAGVHRYRAPAAAQAGAGELGDAALHAVDCHGCGKCRTYCPTFLATGREEDLPRARANLVRESLFGALALGALGAGFARRSLSTCVGCDRCLTDCSSLVDVGAASAAARAAVAQRDGRGRDEELLRRPRMLSGLAAALAPLGRMAGNLSVARAGLELVAGVDRRRRPPPAGRWRPDSETSASAPAPAAPARAPTPQDRVVYFPGCHALNGDPGGPDFPGEGAATVAVLQSLGVRVHVAPEGCCGIARYTYGADDGLRRDVLENLARWQPWLDDGWDLVTTAPSCHHMIAHRYAELAADAARLLDGRVWDLFQWLERGDRPARLRALLGAPTGAAVPVAYHDPCHARIGERSIGAATNAVLAATGLFDVRPLPDRCCGMAGTFGMRTKGYELSMEIAAPQLAAAQASGARLVATGCGTCQTQFREDPSLRPVHPISIIAARIAVRGPLR